MLNLTTILGYHLIDQESSLRHFPTYLKIMLHQLNDLALNLLQTADNIWKWIRTKIKCSMHKM